MDDDDDDDDDDGDNDKITSSVIYHYQCEP